MSGLPKTISDMQDRYEVKLSPSHIELYMDSYFRKHRKNVHCHYFQDDFLFVHYDSNHNRIGEKSFVGLNKNTARALLKHMRKCFEYEQNRNGYDNVKPLMKKVIDCKITINNEKDLYAVFYYKMENGVPVICKHDEAGKEGVIPCTVKISLSKTPATLHRHIKEGAILPLYIEGILPDRIQGNLYAKEIPEQLIRKTMPNAYIRCAKRICGVFSRIITNEFISKKTITKLEKTLHESIYVYILSRDEMAKLKTGQLSIKSFSNKGKKDVRTKTKKNINR